MREIARAAGFLIEHTANSYEAALKQRNAVVRFRCRAIGYEWRDVATQASRPPIRLVVVGVRGGRARRHSYEITNT